MKNIGLDFLASILFSASTACAAPIRPLANDFVAVGELSDPQNVSL